MSGLFSTLNTANKGLMAQQTSLHTVGHNISNMKTKGYSRQRVDTQADLAFNYSGVGQLGTGVKMQSIERITNQYVERQMREEGGTLAQFEANSEAIDQLEIVFNEPSETGLNFNLGEMFASWTELSKNPEISTSKTVVVEKSKTLSDTINHMAKQMDTLRSDTVIQVEENVKDFNQKLETLDKLNEQIAYVTMRGQSPNDLLDQRDLLLKEMSEIVDFDVEFDRLQRAKITIDDQEVLDFREITNRLEVEKTEQKKGDDYSIQKLEVKVAGQKIDPEKGRIKGYLDSLDQIDDAMDELDNFAFGMAKAINDIHKDGGNGKALDFFDIEGDVAGLSFKIKVNDKINKNHSLVNVGNPELEGDGSIALNISNLRHEPIEFTTKSGEKEDATIQSKYASIVTEVGIIKEHSDHMIVNQKTLLNQLTRRREAASGVSLNEEVSDLVQFQSAFNANAKVIATIAEMLDTLIHRTGV